MKIRLAVTAVFLTSLSGIFSASAVAVDLNFLDLPHTAPLTYVGSTYTHDGFTLTYAPAPGEQYPTGLYVIGPSYLYSGGRTSMTANSCSATTTMVAVDNNPFNLKSIELSNLNGQTAFYAIFVGTTADGNTVTKKLENDGKEKWERFDFPETFRNLQNVVWTQGDCTDNPAYMFDNVRVVPKWKDKN